MKKDENSCPLCGAKNAVKPEFNFCYWCGQDLRTPETATEKALSRLYFDWLMVFRTVGDKGFSPLLTLKAQKFVYQLCKKYPNQRVYQFLRGLPGFSQYFLKPFFLPGCAWRPIAHLIDKRI